MYIVYRWFLVSIFVFFDVIAAGTGLDFMFIWRMGPR